MDVPTMRQTVIDAQEGPPARALAEFYRLFLGKRYRDGDAPPESAADDVAAREWLVLHDADGGGRLAIQPVPWVPRATWPAGEHPQMLHLDLTVGSVDALDRQHGRALELGAALLLDRSDDPEEPLRVYADPAGHPFCVFVVAAGE